MPSPGSRRVPRWVLVAVAVLLLVIGGAVAFVLLHAPGNVSHPNVEFTAPTATTTTTTTTTTKPKRRPAPVDNSLWPRYGYDAARTRFFPGSTLRPPFHVGWTYEDYALLEFPPVLYQKRLYVIDDDGSARAIDKTNGHVIWYRKLGTLAAASPAVGIREGLVFFALLSVNPSAGQNPGNGRLTALSMANGRTVWSMPVPPGTESSPTVYGTTLYFGDQSGKVYSVQARTGHVNWTYSASGAVKGGISLADGILYFGDYAGRAYALNAANGHQVWAVSTSGTRFGFGSGNFYASPAVAFGRVYLGNTDGNVYSFAAHTGQLAWSTGTGAYVYASPAVADVPGLGPTVYAGSYDGNFYAFNAQSGAVRWIHHAGGRISGSATIVGNVVYYSDLGSRTTTGLDLRTGNVVFSFPDGAFNPVICDQHTIFLVGYSKIYELLPNPPRRRAAAPRRAHVAARPKRAANTRHVTRRSTKRRSAKG